MTEQTPIGPSICRGAKKYNSELSLISREITHLVPKLLPFHTFGGPSLLFLKIIDLSNKEPEK